LTIGTLLAGLPSAEEVRAVVVAFGVVLLVVVARPDDRDDEAAGDELGAVGDGLVDAGADCVGESGTVEVMVTTTSEEVSFTGVPVPR